MNKLLLGLCLLFLAGAAAATITVDGAYVREMPPGQPNTAAFLELRNDAAGPVSSHAYLPLR